MKKNVQNVNKENMALNNVNIIVVNIVMMIIVEYQMEVVFVKIIIMENSVIKVV